MKDRRFNERPACSVLSAPFPVAVTCPQCGHEIELWSDEEETLCRICRYTVFRHERINS